VVATRKSGHWLSDAIPHLHTVADDLCIVHSMYTEQFNHAPAELLLFSGSPRPGRPSMGSWVTYGLGTENQNLPGFVVLISSGVQPNGGKNSYGSGFLPSVFQGVQCRSKGDPVLYASDPAGFTRELRRESLDTLQALNEMQAAELGHPETRTRIAQYELAYRMQMSVPDVMDISREKPDTIAAYGAQPGESSFANNCLLARRLVEQGVRFVQLFDWGWDFHGTSEKEDIRGGLTKKCATMDQPVAALINDLRQRGLLDETLIVLGGEFGRTPFREGRTAAGEILGRDHYPDCYSMVMAGGGIKGGLSYGETDELGFNVTKDKVHVHDLQATILHQLGFNHERLTFRFEGRDYRLTERLKPLRPLGPPSPLYLGRNRARAPFDSDSDTDSEGILRTLSGCGLHLECRPRVGLVPRPTRGYRLPRLRRWGQAGDVQVSPWITEGSRRGRCRPV
jgi:hypothetical protein